MTTYSIAQSDLLTLLNSGGSGNPSTLAAIANLGLNVRPFGIHHRYRPPVRSIRHEAKRKYRFLEV